MTLERGALLHDRYRIVEILGQGGMGAVYRAVDEHLGVEVALKENLFTTDEYSRQFRREALILATVRHPILPRVTDHFLVDDQGQYLVMDYIEGEDLRQRMDRVGMLSEEEVIIIGAAICDALSFLDSHEPPIVHRDIKPGNIKITPTGQIFLVDFGLAKFLQGSQVTTTGARAMTPGYSPPEQYGTARTDHRSDLFSLGATLYAALTGVIPEDALARAMEQVELTLIRKRNPHISRRLAQVLEKALEVRPDDRFQDAQEFKQALLNCRSSTRRRFGEYIISPPPEVQSQPLVEYTAGELEGPSNGRSPRLEANTPTPFPISSPLEMPRPISRPRQRPRRKRGAGWLIWLVLILALLGGGAGLLYLYAPDTAKQILASLPFLPAATNTVKVSGLVPGSTPNPGDPSPTPAPTAIPTATLTLSPSATPTSQPSPTRISAVVIAASATPTIIPTPIGGGGGEIAFASDRTGTNQVWIMNVDGSNKRQLTDMSEGACQPDWSPDGLRIVFISPCSSNQERYTGSGMFIINYDGTGLIPLPTVPGGDFDPAWSPDGKQIVFTSLRNSGRERIYIINLDDNNVTRLSDQYSRDMQPSWSPDGTRIAFVTTRKGPWQIWTMAADGGNQVIYSRSQNKLDSHPAWFPDSQGILFTQAELLGGITRLVAATYTDGDYNEYRFEFGPIPIREARYSPDGLWLAFESWPTGTNHDIYIASGSGANPISITENPRYDFDPDWRPMVR